MRASQLTVFDRRGEILGTVGEPSYYGSVVFSLDGKRVVTSRGTQTGNMKLWIVDLVRGVSTQFTFDLHYSDESPVWSPDGNRIIFSSGPNRNNFNLDEKLSNGGGEAELLLKSDSNAFASSWSNDGRFLLFGAEQSGSQASPCRLWIRVRTRQVSRSFSPRKDSDLTHDSLRDRAGAHCDCVFVQGIRQI